MANDDIITAAKDFAKKALMDDASGHDWWHVVRVRATAQAIHKVEGGDWFTIDLALLLHDVGDRKVIHKDDDDYTIAYEFMVAQYVPHKVVDQVMSIIKHMSFSRTFDGDHNETSIEFKIVQDADRLDAIGAIGIARAFAFGGTRSRPLYDPTYTAKDITTRKQYIDLKGSTYHHFEEKLLKIKDMLNTPTARSIADKRHQYMESFLDEFIDEWNGKK